MSWMPARPSIDAEIRNLIRPWNVMGPTSENFGGNPARRRERPSSRRAPFAGAPQSTNRIAARTGDLCHADRSNVGDRAFSREKPEADACIFM
jgi:hypothetical protein